MPPQPPRAAPGALQLAQEAAGEGGAQGRRVIQEPLPHFQAVRRRLAQVGKMLHKLPSPLKIPLHIRDISHWPCMGTLGSFSKVKSMTVDVIANEMKA